MITILKGFAYIIVYPILTIYSLVSIVFALINGLIFQFCWLRPASAVALTALLCNFTTINLLTFLTFFIGEFFINLILVNVADGITMKRTFLEFINYFYYHYYEPIKIDNLNVASIGKSKISKLLQYILQVKPFAKFFHVWSDKSSDIIGNLNARQMVGAKSWVFAPTNFPKIKGLVKFTLLHEIGHASIPHLLYHKQSYFVLVYLFIFLLNIHSRSTLQTELIWITAVTILFWILYLLFRRPLSEIKTEMFADRYALLCIKDESDYHETVDKIEKNYLKNNNPLLAEHIKHSNELISEIKKDEFALFEYVISLFKLGGLPPVLVSVPVGVSVIYIGTQINGLNYQNLGILLLIFTLLPMFVYYFTYKYYFKIKASFFFFIQERQPEGKQPITFDDCF